MGVLLVAVFGAGVIALIGASIGDLPSDLIGGDAVPSIGSDGTVAVQPGITVRLPAGWEIEAPLADGIHVTHGDASAYVVVREQRGPRAAIREYVQESLVPDADGLSWSFPAETEIGGRPAARATYSGRFVSLDEDIDGRLVAVEDSGSTVLVDAWAPDGAFGSTDSDVNAIVESVDVE